MGEHLLSPPWSPWIYTHNTSPRSRWSEGQHSEGLHSTDDDDGDENGDDNNDDDDDDDYTFDKILMIHNTKYNVDDYNDDDDSNNYVYDDDN